MGAGQFSDRDVLKAKFACAYAGAAWGLFWIPLRKIEALGIVGPWPGLVFFVIPLVVTLPFLPIVRRALAEGGTTLQVTGLVAGIAIALYANAVIYTEVVRATLLFYMMPVWSMVLARVWLGEQITGSGFFAIVVGLVGMAVVLHVDSGFPWPGNPGDWMGLASGIVWAFAAVLMRRHPQLDPRALSLSFLWWTTLCTFSLAVLPFAPSVPDMAIVLPTAWWLVPTALVIVLPAFYATIWGAPKLNPGIVGVFFMTEITVGAGTAALWAGEPFGLREGVGIALISLAGVVEVAFAPVRRLFVARSRSAP